MLEKHCEAVYYLSPKPRYSPWLVYSYYIIRYYIIIIVIVMNIPVW